MTGKWQRPAPEVWSLARIDELQREWASGASATLIGARMGLNKNQVLGKVHRLGLPIRKEQAPRAKPKPRNVPQIAQLYVARLFPAPEPRLDALVRPLVTRRAALPIPRGAVGPARECQWPENDRRPWAFCCQPSIDGYSYCDAHKARAFIRRGEAA